jgi:tyrosyl-tRNA synthetase
MADPLATLTFGAAEIVPRDGLRAKLELGRPLRVKLGIDPNRPDLHLGHSVVLRTLRRFQDLGHTAVLIIGDFTGRVGDPSGRSETRTLLSAEEMEANARSYFDQAGHVLDLATAEVRHNAEWLGAMDMEELVRLASAATVAQMLDRDDFRSRYQGGQPISIVEFLYPLFQAMDSVQVRADVEIGGTDQTFNLLLGREIQRAYGQEPQVVLTTPLLEGTDGVRKMSKSFDNYVGLAETADDMFGKVMRVPDELVVRYLRLTTGVDAAEADRVEAGLADGGLVAVEQKRRLAREIVDLYHGAGAGSAAEERFDRVHRDRELPHEVAEAPIPVEAVEEGRIWLPRLLVALGRATSNGEARRLIEQGGVRLDGELVVDPGREFDPGDLRGRVLQVGRRWFGRLA